MRTRFTFILVLAVMSASSSMANLQWADIGLNGLTCSLCSRSVEMSLLKLDFVDRVEMSLETTEGRIFFKAGPPVDLNAVARAVVNAGFSVRYLRLQMNFDNIPLKTDGSFMFHDQKFQWINAQSNVRGPVSLKLIGEKFLPKKENAEWSRKNPAVRTGDRAVYYVVRED